MLLLNNDEETTILQLLEESPSVLLPLGYLKQSVLPAVVVTILGVSLVYAWVAWPVASKLLEVSTTPDDEDDTKKAQQDRGHLNDEQRRLAYQITNGVINTVLGLMGFYYQYIVLATKYSTTTGTTIPQIQDKIQGHEDLYWLGSFQIGYQIWSLAIGIFYLKESTQMLFHHFAALLAASKSILFVNGFRYYAAMALGMLELSSVPLSVMNAFKQNDAWQAAHPQAFLASRLVFSFVFLWIRIGLFVPQHLEYLQLAGGVTFLSFGRESLAYSLFMSLEWLGAAFLLYLQLHWGWLIIQGLSNRFLGSYQIRGKVFNNKSYDQTAAVVSSSVSSSTSESSSSLEQQEEDNKKVKSN